MALLPGSRTQEVERNLSTLVRSAQAMMRLPLADALAMAARAPACFLGLAASHGCIAAGWRADLVALDGAGVAKATWIGGERAWVRK